MNKFPELKTLPTQEEINELKQRNAELMAQVEQLREVINHYQEGQVPSDNAMDELIHRANKAPAQSLAEYDREVAARAVEEFRAALVESVSLPFKAHIDGACDVAQHQISLAAKAGEV